jgi:hypothetical protein
VVAETLSIKTVPTGTTTENLLHSVSTWGSEAVGLVAHLVVHEGLSPSAISNQPRRHYYTSSKSFDHFKSNKFILIHHRKSRSSQQW